jgi:6-pyruvoyltetrahydropterin/6-carboxytetrahydropterin synthase|tara:strand:+ start:45 stop:395 length:351 start_codon:yes stop_codon:yes gene_type:complete
VRIYKDFSFESAHRLPLVPENHQCFNLHGHSFNARITISGELLPQGWVMDFGEVKKICSPIINILDHSYLNEIEGLENPTSENIAIWLWEKISKDLQGLYCIEVKETCNSGCLYFG